MIEIPSPEAAATLPIEELLKALSLLHEALEYHPEFGDLPTNLYLDLQMSGYNQRAAIGSYLLEDEE